MRFAWNFDPAFHYNSSNIISTIGFSMMGLALLIHLRPRTLLVIGLAMVIGHNAFDQVSFADGSAADVLWSFLHVRKLYALPGGRSFLFLYPLVPWVGVMALGFCLGRMYEADWSSERRRRVLYAARGVEPAGAGPLAPGQRLRRSLALVVAVATGCDPHVLSQRREVSAVAGVHRIPDAGLPALKGRFGFTLAQTWAIWAGIVVLLYPLCARWNAFKARHAGEWWVSYV